MKIGKISLYLATALLCLSAADVHARRLTEEEREERLKEREERRKEAEERRQAILEERAKVKIIRDSCRRLSNVLVGVTASYVNIDKNEGDNPDTAEQSGFVGFTVAYRKHFLPMLGVKVGTRFSFAPTSIEINTDSVYGSTYYPYSETVTSSGIKGSTFLFTNSAQAIFGPFNRITIEPGLGITWGSHTADTMAVTGDAGYYTYAVDKHFSFIDGIIGSSFYIGDRDDYEVNATLIFGGNSSQKNTLHVQFILGLSHSFQLK